VLTLRLRQWFFPSGLLVVLSVGFSAIPGWFAHALALFTLVLIPIMLLSATRAAKEGKKE
jgi:hypothetical protein